MQAVRLVVLLPRGRRGGPYLRREVGSLSAQPETEAACVLSLAHRRGGNGTRRGSGGDDSAREAGGRGGLCQGGPGTGRGVGLTTQTAAPRPPTYPMTRARVFSCYKSRPGSRNVCSLRSIAAFRQLRNLPHDALARTRTGTLRNVSISRLACPFPTSDFGRADGAYAALPGAPLGVRAQTFSDGRLRSKPKWNPGDTTADRQPRGLWQEPALTRR